MGHLHAFFLENSDIDKLDNKTWTLDTNEVSVKRHIKALRLKNKDELIFLNGLGSKLFATIDDVKSFIFKTSKIIKHSRQSPIIDLAISPPKNVDFERCIQICTELEVRNIYLFKSDYSDHTKKINIGRLNQISQSSCEQSLNAWSPKLHDFMDHSLSEFLDKLKSKSSFFMYFDENLSDTKPKMFSIKTDDKHNEPLLFFGPEGGWSPKERQTFSDHKILSESLGPLILKVPTAIACAMGVIRSQYAK